MSIAATVYDQIADALADTGYCVLADFLPKIMVDSLYQRVTHLSSDEFSQAGIGRKNQFQLNDKIRNDRTYWLAEDNAVDQAYLDCMEALKDEINQRLYMGLFRYESHYAHYAEGSYYQRHVDAFKGQSNRILTTLLYLNPDWSGLDGGELVMYDPDSNEQIEKIQPHYGKFILFLSDRFPHEVLAAKRDRYSISGWFHLNS
ncbi:MAG: proline hydroxylase [Gammaproteobacteria bacterium]|nr:MAG: proline hydroxylase [Gammaproteobacteria bacterium]